MYCILSAYWGDEVGGSGGDSGTGWRGGVSESFGEEGPHHSVTGKQQASTHQPQRDVELQTISISSSVFIFL